MTKSRSAQVTVCFHWQSVLSLIFANPWNSFKCVQQTNTLDCFWSNSGFSCYFLYVHEFGRGSSPESTYFSQKRKENIHILLPQLLQDGILRSFRKAFMYFSFVPCFPSGDFESERNSSQTEMKTSTLRSDILFLKLVRRIRWNVSKGWEQFIYLSYSAFTWGLQASSTQGTDQLQLLIYLGSAVLQA